MKKLNLCIAGLTALFCTYCSESSSSNVAGTSEEMNELAVNDSSSSTDPQQDSSSSITDKSSSSITDHLSSSTDIQNLEKNSLDAYVQQFRLSKPVAFDKAVLSMSTSGIMVKTPTVEATEFDGEGVRKFVKQNIAAIKNFFPNASEKYADLVESTKNGTNECSLYMYNLYGNEKYHVLEHVSPDTLKVVDITAKNCETNTNEQVVHFLFSYCGDMNNDPVIVHNTAESSIAKDECPASKTDEEWVSVIETKDINSSSSANATSSSSIVDPVSSSSSEENNRSQARNISLTPREGPAVAPSVVMVKNEDGTITIRDDGYNAANDFVFEDVYTELSGDTIIVDVIYPDGANTSSFQIGVLTFTVSKVYTDVKYLTYADGSRSVQTIYEEDELLPCANNGSCQECPADMDCSGMTW